MVLAMAGLLVRADAWPQAPQAPAAVATVLGVGGRAQQASVGKQ